MSDLAYDEAPVKRAATVVDDALSQIVENVDALGHYIEKLEDRLSRVLNSHPRPVSDETTKDVDISKGNSDLWIRLISINDNVMGLRNRVGMIIDRLDI